MKKTLLILDQGTSSSRAVLTDTKGQLIAFEQQEIFQNFPQFGWVEQNPEEIFSSMLSVIRRVIKRTKCPLSSIEAIGITNQRETTIVWDKETGKPLYPAIVWQDRRTDAFCRKLEKQGLFTFIHKKTGLVIDPYFSGSKLKWLFTHVPSLKQKAKKGLVLFGTVDTYLLWRLTKGKEHKTDPSNASRTQLFNIKTQIWDTDLLKLFNIPPSVLPQISPSSGLFGKTYKELLGREIPITAMIGDQQSALFGQMCWKKGMMKTTYGTACSTLVNTGTSPLFTQKGLLTSVGWQIGKQTHYCLEGTILSGANVLSWVKNTLHWIKNYQEIDEKVNLIDDLDSLFFVPAFNGLGAPHWSPTSRGLICGITDAHTPAHFIKAILDALAHQTADIVQIFQGLFQKPLNEIRVDGGISKSSYLLQTQADFLQIPIKRAKESESTALGCALLTAIGAGIWKKPTDIPLKWKSSEIFFPQKPQTAIRKIRHKWKKALSLTKSWP